MKFRIAPLMIIAVWLSMISSSPTTLAQDPPHKVYIPIAVRPAPPLSEDPIERINGYRLRAGVPPVVSDPVLAGNCALHALYMALNNQRTPSEDPNNQYYTPQGAECAPKSLTWILRESPAQSYQPIDTWMELPNLRPWLLYPFLERVGFGFHSLQGPPLRSAAALDVISGIDTDNETYDSPIWPVKYPGEGQTDVPATAYPITLFWKRNDPQPTIVSTQLRVVGGDAIAHTSAQLNTGASGPKGVVVTPSAALPANSLIEVTIVVNYSSTQSTYTWTFRTTSE